MNLKALKEYYKLMKDYNNPNIWVNLDSMNQLFIAYMDEILKIKDSYLNIIKKCTILLKELQITNPYLAAAFYNHLLWGGYFSINKELIYNKKRIILPFYNGAVVTTGNAACLEFSELEAQILNELGFKAYSITCIYNEDKVSIISEIKRHESKNDNNHNQTPKDNDEYKFNHAITLIESEEGFFLADPTNIQLLNIRNLIFGKLIFNNSYLTLDYNSIPIRSNIKTEELVALIKKIQRQSNKKLLTPSKTKEIFDQATSLFNDNNRLIDDYYLDSKEDIEDVSKKLIKYYEKNKC